LLELLFSEETVPGTCHPDEWHGELDEFIDRHRDYQVMSG